MGKKTKRPYSRQSTTSLSSLETNLSFNINIVDFDEDRVARYEKLCKMNRTTPCSKLIKCLKMDVKNVELNLTGYGMNGEGTEAICQVLYNQQKITSINLSRNAISSKGLFSIMLLCSKNEYITELQISDNNLSNSDTFLLSKGLQYMKYLELLDLSMNHIGNYQNFTLLCTSLSLNQSIENLSLSDANISNYNAVRSIGFILSKNKSLKILNLSWNVIRCPHFKWITNNISRSNVKSLDLSWNGISCQGAQVLATVVKGAKKLKHLNISSNRISFIGFAAIIKSVANHECLVELKMGSNPVNELTLSACFSHLSDLSKIKLNLLDNITITCIKTHQEIERLMKTHQKLDLQFGYIDNYGKKHGLKNNFVQAALLVMRHYCLENNKSIIDLFTHLDKDGNMSVSHDEFRQGIRDAKLPLTMTQVDAMIKSLDQDSDGEIDFSELILGSKMCADL